MNIKTVLTLFVVGFVIFCGALIIDSGMFENKVTPNQTCILLQQTADANDTTANANPPVRQDTRLIPAQSISYTADNAPEETIILGAADPNTEDPETGFKLQLQLTTKGAAIYKATFSNGNENGFDDRDHENPQPLKILSNVGDVLSMANTNFTFVKEQLQLPLHRLHWKSLGVQKSRDGSQTAAFETIIKNQQSNAPVIKLVKTYKIEPSSYHVVCDITVENLSADEQNIRFNLAGPVGIKREGARSDMRKIIGGFVTNTGEVVPSKKNLMVGFPITFFRDVVGLKDSTAKYKNALQSRNKSQIRKAKEDLQIGRNLPNRYKTARFSWAATTNKYFAAILRPVPDKGKDFCDWIKDKTSWFYNPDGDDKSNSGDETIGINLEIAPHKLSVAGLENSSKKYNFNLYLGPKDKKLFDKNEYYRNLGFVYTINFMGCCCPAAVIRPLAFGILAIMDWMYGILGNYGVVIIILVFLIRLIIHPLTKKSQISMNRMQKLGPKVAEIKKKYANNKAEQHKQTMALYKESNVSPVSSMLPMLVQMPVWISLYSAIYASIALRGAAFLPFWITDLSAPDALFRFKAVTLPLFGVLDSFNLLPIMMGFAFYFQQKLMPKPAATNADSQIAQQQKMMMIMMPLLFPLMLYKAPSGLNLYIMASTFAGVYEQYVIRKHIRKKEQAESIGVVVATSKTGGKVKKKKPKPFYKNM